MKRLFFWIAILFVAVVSHADEAKIDLHKFILADNQQEFKCDGRQYCSQMRSCAEAKFFIENCPNTKMDGDHDGKPCENWCGH